MPESKYMTYAISPKRMIALIESDWLAIANSRRGNVLWILTPLPAGSIGPHLGAFLVYKMPAGWRAKKLEYWKERYLTCPLRYVRACRPLEVPGYQTWVKRVEQYHAQLSKKQKTYRKQRQQIELGDLIKLHYQNVPSGVVISKSPLIVLHGEHRYQVNMSAFRGWIAHAREKSNNGSAHGAKEC
jgi:hypothetical protein